MVRCRANSGEQYHQPQIMNDIKESRQLTNLTDDSLLQSYVLLIIMHLPG